jgi:hypothetical protein
MKFLKMGVVVHTYNPALGKLREEDCKSEASLGYKDLVYKKKKKKRRKTYLKFSSNNNIGI